MHRAIERGESLTQRWLKKDYPQIKALAKEEGAISISAARRTSIPIIHHAGRTWGARGETPIVHATGERHGMSLISAIT